jgi:hypothetical protein
MPVAPTALNPPRPPNVIVPSVSAEIRSPLCPSCRYSIEPLLLIADIPNVQRPLLPHGRRVRVKVLL